MRLKQPRHRIGCLDRTGVAHRTEGQALNARSATLSSINPDYPPRVVPRRDIEWMARILWVSQ